jgi:(1->4)-alpha-D-glucan 1-alpha-D-glucosylmutase
VNEVGGSPENFGLSLDEFHAGNLKRAELWPASMLSTSTHDTKRSEDVRARINVLSEMPRHWSAEVMRWRRWNRTKKKTLSDGRTVPDANEEYLLYQTLVGSWPWHVENERERAEYVSRLQEYMTKAVHEAKVNLSWINPNPEYVQALTDFVTRILTPGGERRPNRFFEDVVAFARITSFFGALNSIAQALLKLTVPGVPDIYQGNELFDLSLVDPDNRRPVNYEVRRRLLNHLIERTEYGDLPRLCAEMLRDHDDSRMKLWVTMRALGVRRQRPALFRSGVYVPLHCTGEREQNLVAFARANLADFVLTAVPRFSYSMVKGELRAPLKEVWGDSEIGLPPEAPDSLLNVLTGEELKVGGARSLLCREVFAHFPVALLVSR